MQSGKEIIKAFGKLAALTIKECSTNEDDGIGNKGGELQLDNGVGEGEGLYAVTIDMLGKNINAVPKKSSRAATARRTRKLGER